MSRTVHRILRLVTSTVLALLALAAPLANAADNTIYAAVDDQLYTLNSATGAVTSVSTLSFVSYASGRDITTGRIYYLEQASPYRVAYFDPATGTNTILPGQLGFSTNRAAVDASGALWVMNPTNNNLYTVNTSTGTPTFVGTVSGIGTGLGGDIAFSPSGQLYVIATRTLYSVSSFAATSVATNVGNATGCPGLAFIDGNGPIVACGTQLYRVNLSTGASSLIGSTGQSISDLAAYSRFADVAISKTAGSAVFTRGSNATYTLAVSNNGPQVASGPFTVTDTLPAGLSYGSASGSGWNCSAAGQVVTCTNNAASLNSGSSLANLVLTVAVGASAANQVTNTATVRSTSFDSNSANDSSTAITSVGAPTIAKSFSPALVTAGAASTLSLVITNNSTVALSGVAFSDPFPSGLVVAATPTLVNGCGGTVTGATAGSASVALSSGTLAAGASCTISLSVSSSTVGSYANTTTGVSSTQTGAAGAVSNTATLDVVAPIGVSKSFTPDSIGPGATSTLRVTLTNSSALALSTVAFTDTFPTSPAQMRVASAPNATNTCGGSLLDSGGATLAANDVGIRLSGGAIAAGGSCVITVDVTAPSAGSYVNTIAAGAVTSNRGSNTAAASATLLVPRPGIAKFFTPAIISTNSPSTLTITLSNSSATPYTGAAFTDTYPTTPGTGLKNAASPAAATTCGGTVTAAANGTGVALSGGTIPANGSCQVTVQVTATAAGDYTNTIAAGGLTTTNGGSNAAATSATLTANVAPDLQLSKSHVGNFAVGVNGVFTLSVNNTLGSAASSGTITVTDTLPTGLSYVSATGTGWSCSASGQVVTCTSSTAIGVGATNPNPITLTVAVAAAAAPGVSNSASVSGGGEANNTNNAASDAVVVLANPVPAKSFTPAQVGVGANSVLAITLSNPNASTAISGVAFSDAYPAGLVNSATPAVSNSCGGTVTAAAGAASLALSGATIPAGGSCTISVNVRSAVAGVYTNSFAAGLVTSTNAGASATATSAALTVTTAATIVKSFTPASVAVGASSTLSLVISNPNPIALSGLAFGDTFPAGGLQVAATPALANSCGGTISGASAGSTVLSLAGGSLAAGASCTISVAVTSANPGSFSNTTTGVSANEAATGTPATPAVLAVVAPDLRLTKSHSGSFVVGATGDYTLLVDNQLGTAASSGTISVSDTLPTGLSFVAAGSGGTGWSCSASGQNVTCTSSSVIAAGASAAPLTIRVGVAATARPGVTNAASVAGGAEPAASTGNNQAFDPTLVVDALQSLFQPDGAQTALPGSTVFYAHSFAPAQGGTLSFSVAESTAPTLAGWSALIYRDLNCNAVLDGTEGDAPLSAALAATAGTPVCIVVKVAVPATAPQGAQHIATVTAGFTPSSGAPLSLSRTDTTTVGNPGSAGLVLGKSVRNISAGGGAATSNAARPGDLIEYTISFVNNGSDPIASILIHDATPAFTIFVSAACTAPLPANITSCAASVQPAVGGTGAIRWTLGGSLAPGATGSVSFRVQL